MRGRAVPRATPLKVIAALVEATRWDTLDRLRMGDAYADTDTVGAGMKRCNALFKPRANTLGITA